MRTILPPISACVVLALAGASALKAEAQTQTQRQTGGVVRLDARALAKCRPGTGQIEVTDEAGRLVPISVFGALGGAYQALGRGDQSPRVNVEGGLAVDGPTLASAAGVPVSVEPAAGLEPIAAGSSSVICFTGAQAGSPVKVRLRLGASMDRLAALAPAYFPDWSPGLTGGSGAAPAAVETSAVATPLPSPASERPPRASAVPARPVERPPVAAAAPKAAAPVSESAPIALPPPPPPPPPPPKPAALAARATTLEIAANAPNSVRYAYTEHGAHLLVKDKLAPPKGRVEIFLIKPAGRTLKKVVLKGSRPEEGTEAFEREVRAFDTDLEEVLTIGGLLKEGYDHVLEVTWGPAG